MAELINEIISPEAFKQVADMKAELASLTKQMEDMLKVLNSPSSPTGKPPLKDLPKQLKENEEALKQLRVIQNQIVTTNAKLAATETQYGEELAKSRLQLQQYNAELKQNAKEQQMASGSLDQMRANLNRLEKAYSGLSAVARQGEIGKAMFAEFTKAKEGVTLLEQSMGNYKRNVGNYTNATFQLTQVLREMPAFAYSAQTGIMAISNNLPMLADGFKQVREQTGSTMKAIAIFGRSLFSFANLFSIAIGFVSLFSKEIMGLFKSTSLAQEALDALSEGLKSGGLDTAISDYYRLTQSVELVNKGLMSQKQALDLYNSTMGQTTGELKSWDSAEQMIVKNGARYLQGLQLKTEALALYNESAKKAVELEMLQQNPDLSFFEKIKAFGMIFTPDFFKGYLNIGQSFADAQKALFGQKLNELEDQRKGLREEGNRLLTEYYKIDLEVDKVDKKKKGKKEPKLKKENVEQFDEFKQTLKFLEEYNQREMLVIQNQYNDKKITQDEYLYLTYKRQIEYFNEQIVAYRDYAKETAKVEVDRLKTIDEYNKNEFKNTLKYLDEFHKNELFEIEKQQANKQITNEEANRLTEIQTIKNLEALIQAYKDYGRDTEKLEVDRLKKINDYNEKAAKENIDIIKGNLDSMENMFQKVDEERQKEIDKTTEWINVVTEAINGIGNISSALIDRQIAQIDLKQKRMEEYYDVEYSKLEQLTLSDEERSKRKSALDAQKRAQEARFESERNQALKKQAQIQKATDIMSIITSTAVAIIKAYTEGDPYTKIPRAIAAGVAGATSLASAIAAPLPQFAKGTDNAPEGFAVVGERGTELVVNPDGTSWLTPAKDTITYLKKGAKVVPNNELMDMVKYANYVNVGGIKQGETGGLFGMALVAEFQQLSEKVDGLTRIMASKNMSVNIQGNYDHYLHVRKNIR